MPRRLTVLLIVLAACGRAAGSPTETTLPNDPCALVHIGEVEAATGGTVTNSGLVPDEGMKAPEFPNPCAYATDGEHGSILVSVDPDGAATFAYWRDRDPVNTSTIGDIGDEAFVYALASLWARIGDGYFVISTQLGAGESGVDDLQTLALSALD